MVYVASSPTSSTKSNQKLENNILQAECSKTRKITLRWLEQVRKLRKQVKVKREQSMQKAQEKALLRRCEHSSRRASRPRAQGNEQGAQGTKGGGSKRGAPPSRTGSSSSRERLNSPFPGTTEQPPTNRDGYGGVCNALKKPEWLYREACTMHTKLHIIFKLSHKNLPCPGPQGQCQQIP